MSTMPALQQPNTPISIARIPEEYLTAVRNSGTDDLGQPVKRVEAQGGEPCRDVLRRARAGEQLLLASFSPFAKPGPYREFGPVFVLADAPDEAPRTDILPRAGSREDYLQERFVIRAYSREEEILDAALVDAPDFAATVDRLFAMEPTSFLHVRFPTYGCFALRIDRA